MQERTKRGAELTKGDAERPSLRVLVAGVLIVLTNGCDAPRTGASRSPSPLAPHVAATAGIEVEKVEGGFVVNNRTASPIVCGAVQRIGVTPRKTVQVAARDTVRIDNGARHVVACEVDVKTAASIAGQSEEEWRRALGVSSSEQAKLVIFEDRGIASSSTAMLASSCEPEPMDDNPR